MFAHAFSFTHLYIPFKSTVLGLFCFVFFVFVFVFLPFGNKQTEGLKTYLERDRYSEIL